MNSWMAVDKVRTAYNLVFEALAAVENLPSFAFDHECYASEAANQLVEAQNMLKKLYRAAWRDENAENANDDHE